MRKVSGFAARSTSGLVVLVLFFSGHVQAHVDLDSPLGGESLTGGFPFLIEWHVAIAHNTENWDLSYSTTGPGGPWIEIATDLSPGNVGDGAPHSFNWQVPNSDIPAAWVRVRQDNVGQDYYDFSSTSFSIAAAVMGDFTGNGIVDGADLLRWRNNFGVHSGALFPDGDDDGDGDVDGNDFLRWQRNRGFNSSTNVLSTVPEPTSLRMFLLILGAASVLIRRR